MPAFMCAVLKGSNLGCNCLDAPREPCYLLTKVERELSFGHSFLDETKALDFSYRVTRSSAEGASSTTFFLN